MCGAATNMMQAPRSTVVSCQASEAGVFKVDADSSERGEAPSRSVAVGGGVNALAGLRVLRKERIGVRPCGV